MATLLILNIESISEVWVVNRKLIILDLCRRVSKTMQTVVKNEYEWKNKFLCKEWRHFMTDKEIKQIIFKLEFDFLIFQGI